MANFLPRWLSILSLIYGHSLYDDILKQILLHPADANPPIGGHIPPALLRQAVETLFRLLHLALPNDYVLHLHLLSFQTHETLLSRTSMPCLKTKMYASLCPTGCSSCPFRRVWNGG